MTGWHMIEGRAHAYPASGARVVVEVWTEANGKWAWEEWL